MKASSSSSSATRKWTHDVFLSFGEDTSHNFTDHLHSNLVQKGIKTFRDDELPRGEEISEISQALVQAIQGSKLSLIVFSENYASSEWCLDQLVHILESKRSNQQRNVRSVFYKVDPSDVKHQRGSFGDALAKHERKFKDNMDKVLRWRTALTEAANLSEWHFSDGYESKFIDEIVEKISAQLKEHSFSNVAKYLVGVESRVQEILERLDVGESDIRMVGIWGTGGIGKTTIAKAVYNSIAHKFEGSWFLENVREESKVHGGLLNLQKILLSKIVESEELKLINVDEGTTLLRERLRHKKILLVLDDVNESYQLEKLAGASNWFGRGSRIIITTRDKHLLFVHEINPIYKVRELDPHEAHVLFISKAFKNKTDLDDDERLVVSSVVEYAQGLPLALVLLGSRLCGTSIHNWQAILDGYEGRSPLQDIQTVLKISYDALEIPEKQVFLDIACFFKDRNKNDVIQILESCGRINPEHSIEVLGEKGLINVECGYIWMHNMLEKMGKEIVHQESPRQPGKRSRLWFHEDVVEVLTKNTGTNKVEGIMVKLPTTNEIYLYPKCFKRMENLKFIINVNAQFCGTVDYPPKQLRFVLNWPEYPLQSLPSNFEDAKTGTSQAEGIMVKLPTANEIRWSPKCFKKMKNVKFVINVDNARFCGTVDYPPEQLRFVDWSEYSLQSPGEANTKTINPQDIRIGIPEPDEISLTAGSFSEASSTERTFLLLALCLEIMSLCFDQLSSPSKPIYALFGMLLAIAALLNCICELIYKGIKEKVVLRRRGMLWWFHYPRSPHVPFGTLPDFYGLVGGLFQCICSAIQYVYFIRHDQNPIKVSLLPTIFVICQSVSRLNWNRRDEPIEQKD